MATRSRYTVSVSGFGGVDAPESRQTCAVAGRDERCGRIAAERLSDHVANHTLACVQQDVDRYGRSVATCRIGDEDLGAWLVREGLVVRYARYAGQAYLIEELDARRAKRGVWRGEFDMPEDWRREQRESG